MYSKSKNMVKFCISKHRFYFLFFGGTNKTLKLFISLISIEVHTVKFPSIPPKG